MGALRTLRNDLWTRCVYQEGAGREQWTRKSCAGSGDGSQTSRNFAPCACGGCSRSCRLPRTRMVNVKLSAATLLRACGCGCGCGYRCDAMRFRLWSLDSDCPQTAKDVKCQPRRIADGRLQNLRQQRAREHRRRQRTLWMMPASPWPPGGWAEDDLQFLCLVTRWIPLLDL